MASEASHHVHDHGSVFSSLWDKLGIVASGLCLIDCIVLPIVSTALLSVQSTFAWAEKLHWLLLPVIGITASMAFYHSWKAHRSYLIVASGTVGFLFLLAGELSETFWRPMPVNVFSVAGSVFLIGAHVRNLVMHLSHKHSCTVDHTAGGRNLFGRHSIGQGAVLTAPSETVPYAQAAQVP